MKMNMLKNMLACGVVAMLLSMDLPKGWYKSGSDPESYEMGIDKETVKDGHSAATIRSVGGHVHGFGTLMQTSQPGEYLGKRVRMTGYMKSKDVTGWAGFWLRTDGPGKHETLTFDNMYNRSIKGTTDWARYEVVLDVPEKATNMAYGALLDEDGQIWFDDIKFEIVDKSVPVTGGKLKQESPKQPSNLSFEE